MKKYLAIGASAFAFAALINSANAADVMSAPSSWTGFHVGIGGGGGWNSYDGDANFDVSPWGPDVPDYMGITASNSDLYGFGTIEGGFDYQFDGTPFVVGVMGSFDLNADNDGTSQSYSESGFDERYADITASLDNSWFVGGRVGYAIGDSSLLYGLVGYTWAKAEVKSLIGFDGIYGDDYGEIDESETVQGLTVGAGWEQMLTEAFSLKVEYRHDFLSSIDWDGPAYDPEWGGVDYDNTTYGKVDFGRDTIRAVLSYRFGI